MTENNSDSEEKKTVTAEVSASKIEGEADKPADLSEKEFKDYIEKVLISHFGEENVEREFYLESRRIPDFKVETHLGIAMIEAKDEADSAIGGKGQVDLYAAHYLSAYGVVLFPESDYEEDLEYYGDSTGFMQYEFKPENPEEAELRIAEGPEDAE